MRALRIPAGQHKVEFKFEPAKFRIGNMISLLSSGLLLLGVVGALGWNFRLNNLEEEDDFIVKK